MSATFYIVSEEKPTRAQVEQLMTENNLSFWKNEEGKEAITNGTEYIWPNFIDGKLDSVDRFGLGNNWKLFDQMWTILDKNGFSVMDEDTFSELHSEPS